MVETIRFFKRPKIAVLETILTPTCKDTLVVTLLMHCQSKIEKMGDRERETEWVKKWEPLLPCVEVLVVDLSCRMSGESY